MQTGRGEAALQRFGPHPPVPLLPRPGVQSLDGAKAALIVEDQHSTTLEAQSDRWMPGAPVTPWWPGEGEQPSRHPEIHGEDDAVVQVEEDVLPSTSHPLDGPPPDRGGEASARLAQDICMNDFS